MSHGVPVDWELAERVAVRASGREPFSASYLADSLQADFEEATGRGGGAGGPGHRAEEPCGPQARARVTDRAGWVHANVNSFQRLLAPAHRQAR